MDEKNNAYVGVYTCAPVPVCTNIYVRMCEAISNTNNDILRTWVNCFFKLALEKDQHCTGKTDSNRNATAQQNRQQDKCHHYKKNSNKKSHMLQQNRQQQKCHHNIKKPCATTKQTATKKPLLQQNSNKKATATTKQQQKSHCYHQHPLT